VEDILREGDPSPSCHLVISGLACRYKILEDGSRQIMAFLVPGDLCDAEVFILREIEIDLFEGVDDAAGPDAP
jgi:CRP-like cAMP-binding protein